MQKIDKLVLWELIGAVIEDGSRSIEEGKPTRRDHRNRNRLWQLRYATMQEIEGEMECAMMAERDRQRGIGELPSILADDNRLPLHRVCASEDQLIHFNPGWRTAG